jgi:murein DD-endopeptidase MepM/ murein hydrolase activator NlpD
VKAIATQESNGNAKSINPDTGATGKWQVMPSNIPSWSKEALGREVSHAEFLNSPQVQKRIVEHRLNLYLNQQSKPGRSIEETIKRVAAAWYSGNPKLWNHTKPQFSNGREYPSIASYTQSVWDLYESQKPSVLDKTREIISTWSTQLQQDPQSGDVIAGYTVSSARGMRMSPTAGIMKMHQGVDLATPTGTPIYAIRDGEIECESWSDAGTVALFTSDSFPGLRFDLLHLDSCIAKPGSKLQVKQGQKVGLTGTWGTGPHLHLAIKSEASGKFLRVRAGWLYWFVSGKEPK